MKLNKKMNCILTAALAVSMAFPGCTLADGPAAKEELEEILENLAESQEKSLLAEDLAFEVLCDAIDDSGLQLMLDMGMTEGTVETLGVEGEVPADGRVVVTTVIDPELKKWMFDTTLAADGAEYVDLSIYADRDMLSLICSELYSGAVAIRSGSFKQQFEGSALQQLMEIEGEIPDFNLKFYPDDDDFESLPITYYQESLEEQAELIEEGMRVEKTDVEGQTVYTAYIRTEDVIEVYGAVMDLYLDLLLQSGLVISYDMEEFSSEYDIMLDQMNLLLGEEIAVNYYMQNGQLQKIGSELVIDPSVIEPETEYAETAENAEVSAEAESMDVSVSADGNLAQDMAETPVTDLAEGTLEEAGIVELEADMEVSDEGGIVNYEIVFVDPSDPYQNFDVNMIMSDLNGNEVMDMTVSKTTQTTGTSERTEISLTVSENGTELYSGTMMWSEYDSETGELDAGIEYADDYDSFAFLLDSTISKEKGKYISWWIDSLSMEVDGEAIGLQGSVLISSEPEEFAAPENPKMIMELEEGELMGVLTEIMYNLEELTAEPETEYMDSSYSEVSEVTVANEV